ncbi:Ig-like domain-containing protein [Radiobacillus sp. PE A8.2]|uniref:Ig-like domain-containing protein n=1 Tax=Radiobacillus sp. PE A8.2 TaxID=3380349 RepID=UPI0038911566
MKTRYRYLLQVLTVIVLVTSMILPSGAVLVTNAAGATQLISLFPADTEWTATRGNAGDPEVEISTSSGNTNIHTVIGDSAETTITVDQTAKYDVKLNGLKTGHSGIYTIEIDGNTFQNEEGADKTFDYFLADELEQTTVDLGEMRLEAGDHTLKINAVDSNATSTDSEGTRARIYVKELILNEVGSEKDLSSVIMTTTSNYLTLDQTAQLTLRGILEDSTEVDLTSLEGVTYTSEDESVITVSDTGLVTPVAQGYTAVNATANIDGIVKNARVNFTVVGERIPGAWYSETDYSGLYDLGTENTGKLVVEYDAIPMSSRIDGVMAFMDSDITPSKWGDLPIIIRFNMDGRFDARNGGSYEELGWYEYRRYVTYHFKVIIDLDHKKLGAWVTTPDGQTNLIAADYDFRSGAPVPDDLGRLLLKTKNPNALRVENLTVQETTEDVPPRPEKPELVPITPSGNTVTVNGFTGEDIQAAIDTAAPGDVVYLPAGTYQVKETIMIQKPIIMKGAAKLLNVGEIEWDIVDSEDNNVPPTWDSQPTEIVFDDNVPYTFDMLEVITDNVRFEDIRFVGGLEDQNGYDQRTEDIQNSIDLRLNGVELITGYGEVYGCEFTRHSQGLVMAGLGFDKTMIVRNSYFHENFRQHSGYGVVSESNGMGTLDVRDSEFERNRHDVIASTAINLTVMNNYMHTNDPIVREYSIDLHPAAYYDGRMVVRNNVMLNTGWVIFHAGSGEVTGNYFGPYENDYHPVYVGPGDKEVFLNQSKPHDIYIGRNINATGKDYTVVNGVDKLAELRYYDFDKTDNDPTKEYLAYNVYEDGVLYEDAYDQYKTHTSDPAPKLGDMYVTQADTSDIVTEVEKGVWYDLHAMAVDPQGADNIAKIGVQIHDADVDVEPGNEEGDFNAENNYFVEADGSAVNVREDGSDWINLLKTQTDGLYVAEDSVEYVNDGSHRKHLTVRFKLLPEASTGLWMLNGYTMDKDGNRPIDLEYYDQMGWEIQVNEPAVTAVTGVTVDKESVDLTVGEDTQLTASVTPEDATNQNANWSSSDETVATVDDTGLVTAIGEGNAVITVTTEDGAFTATVDVTVDAGSSGDDGENPGEDGNNDNDGDTDEDGDTQGDSDQTSDQISIELDKVITVQAGTTVTLPDGISKVVLPDDLPDGTTLKVVTVEPDVEDQGLETAGAAYAFDFVFPDGETYSGTISLTLGYDEDHHDADEVNIYYWNETAGEWELQGGNAQDGAILLEVSHFSTYGVFATAKVDASDGQDQNTDDEADELPETATNMYNYFIAGILLLVIGGITFYWFWRKRVSEE